MSNPLPIKNPLTNIRKLAAAGRRVCVAFLGGSITWGGNCSDNETLSYRARTGAWLARRLGPDKTCLVNAAMGGTGSDVAAFRFQEHVLGHRPDLLFIEFAINDGKTVQSEIEACYESILRRAWRKNPRMGVIILISGSRMDSQCAAVTRMIAERFGLVCIDVGAYKRRLILAGRESDESLFTDTVHPTDHGHEIYAGGVTRELGRLWKTAEGPVPRFRLSARPLHWLTAQYERATMIPAVKVRARGKWNLAYSGFTRFDGTYPAIDQWPERMDWPFPYRKGLLCTRQKGASLEYRGRMYGVGLSLDYRRGRTEIDCYIDGELRETFSMDWAGERFPRYPQLAKPLDGRVHTVRFVLRCGSMNVGYVLVR